MTVTELLAPFTDADTPLGELARTPGLPEAPEALLDHLASAGAPREQQSAAWQLLTLAGAAEQPEHPRAGHGRAMTEERKQVFLETLSATGSPVAAAEAATPWSTGGRGGIQSFYDERKRDPEFADAWTRAEAAALAAVETELVRRAFQPERRPIVSNGQVLGEHQTYDNRLLLRVAARLNPEWREKQAIEHSGQVDHRHGHTVVSLEAHDVLLLSAPERDQFMAMIEKIAAAKEQSREQPNVIEHQPE